jgi:hypothetical protein
MIRMLASNKDGDVIAAAHAINRTLRNGGFDIHTLAEQIEKPSGGLSIAERNRLYAAGFEAGTRVTKNSRPKDDAPSWHDMALFCQQHDDRLREREREFVHDVTARTVWREPTEKQAKWLRNIFFRLGGRLP